MGGLTGGRPPRLKVPRPLLYPIAVAAEAWGRLAGREPLTTMDGVRMAKKRMFFSSAKALRELGYQPRPAAQGLADAIAWFSAAAHLLSPSLSSPPPLHFPPRFYSHLHV